VEITPEMLHKIAHLARLEVKKEEETELAEGLGQVLDWMEQLTEVDTDGVEPLAHITGEINVWREDVASNDLNREDALRLAPQRNERYVKVPKVIE
jgi:aspartyl-tRNA(Asn)/glutamyl-tRNA(Gln) amidotransferase subunit C